MTGMGVIMLNLDVNPPCKRGINADMHKSIWDHDDMRGNKAHSHKGDIAEMSSRFLFSMMNMAINVTA